MFCTSIASFTRPANTTDYTSGDLVADSVTAASVTGFRFSVERVQGLGKISRVTLYKGSTTTTAASFTLYLFTRAPTLANGDNGSFSISSYRYFLGSVACDMSSGATAGSADLVEQFALTNPFIFDTTSLGFGAAGLYGYLSVSGSYAPASGELFEATLEIEG